MRAKLLFIIAKLQSAQVKIVLLVIDVKGLLNRFHNCVFALILIF